MAFGLFNKTNREKQKQNKKKGIIFFNFHEVKSLGFKVGQSVLKSYLLFFFSLFTSNLQEGSYNIHNYAYNFLPTTN